ncbi:uncharacterized protein CC84DRAFT_1106065 [Paraphaeosphaeria sporulosa]|uniref:RNase III domain-containing protein n=1 Tax=Paraphaeosphaeria sporulosa TaxID=1460663 RepID=A0A177BT52_9PLEO|nr:uncharacterized protein CC84DRAFT_1106065 [Paraphaeosphaeria sporulosa]OAF98582.1 hypothetical protein CC84DRAFT_1106065 [Paraphaeosphaeria sporulosa]
MEIKTVQAQIGYQFALPDRLRVALTAAHRSDIDGTSDDGNRGLAKLGMCAVDMIETYRTIVMKNGTSKDANIQNHWFKNKRKRASVCCTLGIDQQLTQSVRQRDQAPSTDVLATALSAILGAIWLDLQTQNGGFPTIVEQTYAILCKLELVLTQVENTSTPLTSFSTDAQLNAPLSHHFQQVQDGGDIESHYIALSSGMWSQYSDDLAHDQAQPYDTVFINNNLSNFDFGTDATENIWDCFDLPGMYEIAGDPNIMTSLGEKDVTAAKRGSIDVEYGIQPVAKMRKTQKKARSHQHDGRDESTLHQRLLEEELEKSNALSSQIRSGSEVLLDHPGISAVEPNSPHLPRLRLFYLTIGSSQTLLNFRAMLHTARNLSHIFSYIVTATLRPREIYAEICRLGNQEALCVLLRRYHVIQLFKTVQDSLFREHGLIVQTPSTHITGQRAMPGNPVNRAQANLTEEVLGMILPGPANGTPQYQKTRRHVSQLRRLANILTMWTDRYGFGVLALLPSGSNESEFNFNDFT